MYVQFDRCVDSPQRLFGPGLSLDPLEDVARLVVPADHSKPTRTLGNAEGSDGKQYSGQGSYTEHRTPDLVDKHPAIEGGPSMRCTMARNPFQACVGE